MRPIDADALWEKIHEHGGCGAAPDTWADGWDKAIFDALDCVEAAPTITPPPRWIPVEERLPEAECTVLAFRPSGLITCCAYWGDGDYYFREAGITHWMPLPEPPKEDLR